MTNEETKARDEQLMASLVVTLTAGHAIERRDGNLRIERDEDSRFVVRVLFPVSASDSFEDARSAVAYYLDLCDPA